jgi:hypothetical protein
LKKSKKILQAHFTPPKITLSDFGLRYGQNQNLFF